ncbi:MAG TPA: hypothetical protein VNJ04_08760 [Gemmatimonadaceae bacterium]|nr:hypothetical protein [Gemmatimonadaceae bacterium]
MSYNAVANIPTQFSLQIEDFMPPRKHLNTQQLIRDYRAGKSELQIAKDLGVSRAVIRTRLIENAIEPRNRSAAELLKWSRMNRTQRAAQVSAAHAASRGSQYPLTGMERRARTVERLGLHVSEIERRLACQLVANGLDVIHQQAVGPYNCDLGAAPVAVEVFGGNWHFTGRHLARTPKRFRYLMESGWHVLVVHVSNHAPLHPHLPNYIAAYVEAARRNPAMRREYRVVRGAGETIAAGSVEDKNISIEWALTHSRNPTTGRYESIAK